MQSGGTLLRKRTLTALLPVIPITAALFLCVPWAPAQFDETVDPSYGISLHYLFAKGYSLGDEVILNFGPLGFLSEPYYYPATYRTLIVSWVFLVTVLFIAQWSVFRQSCPAWLAAVLSVAAIPPLAFNVNGTCLYASLLLLVFHWLHAAPKTQPGPWATRGLYLALTVAVALMALTKFTFLLSAGLVLAVISTDEIVCRRRLPKAPAVFAATWGAGWLLAGQGIGQIVPFLKTSLLMSGGYAWALSKAGPSVEIIMALAAMAVLWAGYTISGVWRHGGRGWLSSVGVGALLWLCFKAGFARQDNVHTSIALSMYVAASVLLFGLLPAGKRKFIDAGRLLVIAVALALLLGLRGWSAARRVEEFGRRRVGDHAMALVSYWSDPDWLRRKFEAARREVRLRNPLPPLQGSVDLLPYQQGVLIAHGFDYRQRPLYHSYMVTAPPLNEANAAFFRGSRAPDYVVFGLRQFGEWLPSQLDSMSWLALMDRYTAEGESGRFIVLRRRRVAVETHLEPLWTRSGSLDQWFEPTGSPRDLLWLKVLVRPTRMGRLAALVFRPPVLRLTIESSNRNTRTFRLVPGIAEAGFLLSPLTTENSEFARLLAGDTDSTLPGQIVRRFRIHESSGPYHGFDQRLTVSLYRVPRPAFTQVQAGRRPFERP